MKAVALLPDLFRDRLGWSWMRMRHWLILLACLAPMLLIVRSRDLAITFWLSAVGALGLGSILTMLVTLIRRVDPATFPAGAGLGWAARVGLGALALLCLAAVLILVVAAVDQVVIAATGTSLVRPS